MSIFSWIKSAPKVADNIFDKDKGLLTQVGSWVGNQQFTDQERAQFDADMGKAVQTFAVATLGENTDRSKARRTIAVEWFRLQIWLIKLYLLAIFIDYLTVRLDIAIELQLSDLVSVVTFSGYVWGITAAVTTFFFGTHALRSSKMGKE